jgi:autotransporter-associated beta strand protein
MRTAFQITPSSLLRGLYRGTQFRVGIAILCLLLMTGLSAHAVDVLENMNNPNRTGENPNETILNVTNVNVNQFGKLWSYNVDGAIFAQPLYVSQTAIAGGTHNLIFIETMEDDAYCFDADSNVMYWEDSFTNGSTIIPVNVANIASGGNIQGDAGIESTPYINKSAGVIYMLARTYNTSSSTYIQTLHALNITNGNEMYGGPVVISASGFSSKMQNQRMGLAMASTNIIISWSSHQDKTPYNGWMMAYNATNLTQVGTFNDTPSGTEGGIWQMGRAPAVDGSGNVYVITGNGTWDGSANFGESFLKLSSSLSLEDWFTPDTYTALNSGDEDLGASGAMLVPNSTVVIGGGKQGTNYVCNINNMGHEQTGNGQIVQSFPMCANPGNNGDGMFAGVAYYDSPVSGPVAYVMPNADHLREYAFNGSTFNTVTVATSTLSSGGEPGGFLSISDNHSASGSGIVWATTAPSAAYSTLLPGTLHAWNADNIGGAELWDSGMNATRDNMGFFSKGPNPTVANGKVYVGSYSNLVTVYGLLPLPPGAITWTGTDPSNPNNWDVGISLNWLTNGASTAYAQGDPVIFNDSATGQTNIYLQATLTPDGVTVSNSLLVYNLGAGGIGGGRISGTNTLTKQGSNVLILDEANSSGSYNDFSGGMTISAGIVQVGNGDHNGSPGTGGIVNNSALVYDRVDNITNANVISGTGSLTQEGTGVLTVRGANSYTGPTLIENGTLQVYTNSAFGPTNDSFVTITNGGTMDIGESDYGNQSFVLGLKQIYVSGWGVNSNGAIINSSTTYYQYANDNIVLVTMQGDTAIGGAGTGTPGNGNTGGRWDFRGQSAEPGVLSTGGHPYNLFKVGGNQIVFDDVKMDTNLANIDVRQGFFELQGTTGLGNPTSNLTVEAGATFGIYQGGTSLNKNFILNGNGQNYTIYSEGSPNNLLGPITLNSGVCIFGASSGNNLTLSNAVSGSGSLMVSNATAATTLFLNGTNNTYNGNTLVPKGTLALNSPVSNSPIITIGSGALLDASQLAGGTLTLASGQTLTGNGAVKGNVIAGNGSTFEPGITNGTMILSNNLTLNSCSTTIIQINKSLSPSNSLAQVTTNVVYGGTLVITNLATNSFAAGDSFKIFSAASYSGAFLSVVPTIPGINLAWNTNTLSSGVLSVVASPTPSPQIVTTVMNGNNFVFSGSNGVANWPYWVLTSTNLALPMTNWTLISTGAFDPYGDFIFTNPINPGAQQSFYLIELP